MNKTNTLPASQPVSGYVDPISTLQRGKSKARAVGGALLCVLFLLLSSRAEAATRIDAWLTITNLPTGNTQSLTWNASSNRVWTNIVVSAASQIFATNNVGNARTNLKVQLDTYKFRSWHVISYGTNTNDVVISAGTNEPIAISIAGLWATVRYVTNQVYISDFVLVPPHAAQSNNFLVWQWTAVATNLAKGTQALSYVDFPFTNFPHSKRTANPPMTNMNVIGGRIVPSDFLAQTGALVNVSSSNMLATNLTGTSLLFTNVSNYDTNGIYTNALRMNVAVFLGTNVYMLSGTGSNLVLTNISWLNGILGGLTNGQLVGTFITNAAAVHGGAGVFTSSLEATNALLANPFLTNATIIGGIVTGSVFTVTGSGIGTWVTIASSSTTAALGPALEFKREHATTNAAVSGDVIMHLIAEGYADTVFKPAARIRAYAQTNFTDANTPARLTFEVAPVGTAAAVVKMTIDGANTWSTNGTFHAAAAEVVDLVGSNYVSGRFVYKAGAVTSLINGNNGGILLGTNQTVELSGGTTIAQIAGFAATSDGDERLLRFTGAVTNWVVNESGSVFSTDAVAANRIKTGTGGDIKLTNQPAWLRVRYRGATAFWEVTDFSN